MTKNYLAKPVSKGIVIEIAGKYVIKNITIASTAKKGSIAFAIVSTLSPDTDEATNKVLIPANQVVVGDCDIQNNLRIFSKFSDRIEDMPGIKKIVELTKFKLKNINISYE